MVSRISHTTFDCRDAYALSTFWKQALGFSDVPGDPNEPGDAECMIIAPAGGPRLLFVEVPEGKQVKNRFQPL
jgi:glyoxalase superfamily protein